MTIIKGVKTYKINQIANAGGELITCIDLFVKGNLVKSKILFDFDLTKLSYNFLNTLLN